MIRINILLSFQITIVLLKQDLVGILLDSKFGKMADVMECPWNHTDPALIMVDPQQCVMMWQHEIPKDVI